MIAVDTESTGLDFHHGCRPFFVTVCDGGKPRYWEWDVNPLTREVVVPARNRRGDLQDILRLLRDEGEGLVLHNAKFDVTGLTALYRDHDVDLGWRWDLTYCSLLAGHLLSSNTPKNLTDMGVQWLGVDIEPFERELERVVQECRRYCRSHFPEWVIAKEGLECMPSAKSSGNKPDKRVWKADAWLPRRLAQELNHPDDHPWWTVTSDYANADSAVTYALWDVLRAEVKRRGLWDIYEERRRLLRVAYEVESRGVTVSRTRLRELKGRFSDEAEECGKVCVGVAADRGFELSLPKSGVNNSLREFMFDHLGLEHIQNPKAKTDAPTLNKDAMTHYLLTLPPRSEEHAFVRNLLAKRGCDTAVGFMEAYERFWVQEVGDVRLRRLHPNSNPCGTDTLRWATDNPNSQNISKKEDFNVRYCFGPGPGREWWSLDFKNVELRIPAYLSGEPELIALFEREKEPPYYGSNHLLNFHVIYQDLWEGELGRRCNEPKCCNGKVVDVNRVGPHCKKKFESTWYKYCKNGDFALQYGAGDYTADKAFHRKGAAQLLRARFSRLEALNQECIRFADKHGYVETIPDRSIDPRRGYPLRCARTDFGRVLPTIPLNYKVQGTAMQLTNRAMVRCDDQLGDWRRGGFDAYIALQVHDEMVFDLPRGVDPRVDPARSNLGRVVELRKLMEQGGDDIGVPTPVQVEFNPDNWSVGIAF